MISTLGPATPHRRVAAFWGAPQRSVLTVWRNLFAVMLAILPVLQGTAVRADMQGDIELLTVAAAQHQANKERILTWTGRVVITGAKTENDRPTGRLKASVEFAFDRKKEATRWNWTYEESVRIDNDVEIADSDPGFVNGMLSNGAFHQLGLVRPKSDKGRYTLRILPADDASPGPASDDFDPMYWFSLNGLDLAERFRFLHGNASGPGMECWSVSRADDRVILETGGSIANRSEVDLSQGGNLVAYLGSDPGVTENFTYRYQEVAGVWIPETIVYENVRKDTGTTHTRRLEWVDNTVNEPLAADEFSLVKMGLRRGDRVKDGRSGAEYTIQGDEYPPPPGVEYPPDLARPWTRTVMLASLTLLAVLLVVVLWLWSKGRKAET